MSEKDLDELKSRLGEIEQELMNVEFVALEAGFSNWSGDARMAYAEAVVSQLTREEKIKLSDRINQDLMEGDLQSGRWEAMGVSPESDIPFEPDPEDS